MHLQLPGIVAEDHRPRNVPAFGNGTQVCALGGHPDGVRMRLEQGDVEGLQMYVPGIPVEEVFPWRLAQQPDDPARQLQAPHVLEGDVIECPGVVSGTQVIKEVEPALRCAAPEVGEEVVADQRAEPVPALVAGAGVVHGDPVRTVHAGLQDLLRLGDDADRVLVQDPCVDSPLSATGNLSSQMSFSSVVMHRTVDRL